MKRGARASRTHWLASRRPAQGAEIVTFQWETQAPEFIGGTPMKAIETVALPFFNRIVTAPHTG